MTVTSNSPYLPRSFCRELDFIGQDGNSARSSAREILVPSSSSLDLRYAAMFLIHLVRLQGFEVFDANHHGSQFPVTGDPDPFARIHGAPEHVRELAAQFASTHFTRNGFHTDNCSNCVHRCGDWLHPITPAAAATPTAWKTTTEPAPPAIPHTRWTRPSTRSPT